MFGALRLPLEGVVERFAHVSIYLWLVTGLPSSERNFDALLTLSCPMFRRPEPLWVYLSKVPKLFVMGIFWTELSAAAGTAASRSYADLMCIRSSGGTIGHAKMRSITLFHEQGFIYGDSRGSNPSSPTDSYGRLQKLARWMLSALVA